MKPTIGLLAQIDGEGTHSIYYSYIKAIDESGGVSLILPYTEDGEILDKYVSLCDGFCLTGGVDIDPKHYGEEKTDRCGNIQPMRDVLELGILPRIIASGKPLLGICRGAQVINVALGGTLYQDIASELGEKFPHQQIESKYELSHEASVTPGTPLSALADGETIRINSFHHQAVKKLGRGLEVMATAPDGVVEAFYSTTEQYIRAYQWHPERLFSIDDLERKIFIDFINKAKDQKEKEN